MKPTQEQVIAWALDTGCWETDSGELVVDEMNLTRFATLAYEAGRKDENEACAKVCEAGTGEPVQMKTLDILRKERERIAFAIRERGAP